MVEVKEALVMVMQTARSFGSEKVKFEQALGRVLDEPLIADRPFPPFDRVSMDGIAIQFDSYLTGQKHWRIQEMVGAGEARATLTSSELCIEIMTGAVLPHGCDTVIRYEDLVIRDGVAELADVELKKCQNVHSKGIDRTQGDILVAPSCQISSAEIGVAATVGKALLKVKANPKIVIVSSGDELVDVSRQPLEHQIRKSNVYQIQGILKSLGQDCKAIHLLDDFDKIKASLERELEGADCMILSGGVSAGKKDYIPQVLSELGVEKKFHKVLQRPGKPFWFGQRNEKVVFAFPGNPVSSFMCMHKYFVPWLKASLGLQVKHEYGVLSEDIQFRPDLQYFLEVGLTQEKNGMLSLHPMRGNGSGDLSNLVRAQAFVELPKGKDSYRKGEVYPIIRFV